MHWVAFPLLRPLPLMRGAQALQALTRQGGEGGGTVEKVPKRHVVHSPVRKSHALRANLAKIACSTCKFGQKRKETHKAFTRLPLSLQLGGTRLHQPKGARHATTAQAGGDGLGSICCHPVTHASIQRPWRMDGPKTVPPRQDPFTMSRMPRVKNRLLRMVSCIPQDKTRLPCRSCLGSKNACWAWCRASPRTRFVCHVARASVQKPCAEHVVPPPRQNSFILSLMP